jgi:hypothetical protein
VAEVNQKDFGHMPKSKDLTIDGVTKTVKEWADQYGLPTRVIRERMELGWSGVEVLAPVRKLAFHGAMKGGKPTPEFSGGYGAKAKFQAFIGQEKQRRELRAWELPMGTAKDARREQAHDALA